MDWKITCPWVILGRRYPLAPRELAGFVRGLLVNANPILERVGRLRR